MHNPILYPSIPGFPFVNSMPTAPTAPHPWDVEELSSTDSEPLEILINPCASDDSDLQKALDCRTSSEWLARAARSSKEDILQAVARNPNTPERELLRLWIKIPEAAVENPIITLWEFTSSAPFASRIPKKKLASLYEAFLMRPGLHIPLALIPIDWRMYFLKSNDFAPRIPLQFFVRDPEPEVRLAILQRALRVQSDKSGPVPFSLEFMELLLTDASPALQEAFACAMARKWIAVEPDSVEFLEKTARQFYSLKNESLVEQLSQWECLPPDLITAISLHAPPRILVRLVALPHCTIADHERLSTNDFPEVRAAVARFTRSTDLQERLFVDPSPEVRAGLASSQHISDDMQRRLILVRNADIHQALIKNPRVLPEVLAHIAKLPYIDCKNQIFVHPNIPRDVFDDFISNSSAHGVSHGHLAAKPELLTPELYDRHKHHFEQCVLIAYVKKPQTPVSILAELACHASLEIRKEVNDRLSIHPGQASFVSDNSAIEIIETVLNHPATYSNHPLLRCERMSPEQSIRIFENPRFTAVLRFSPVLNLLKSFRNRGLFSDYAALYRKIAEPLTAMVPRLPLTALRPLTNQSELPTIIREILRNSPDGSIRASNFAQSCTIPLGAIIEAFPEAFPSDGEPSLQATPHQILEKLAASPHSFLSEYATRCLNNPPDQWPKLVGRYPK